MVKKFTSIVLILLVPMQAMAALTMDLQMQKAPSVVFSSAVAEAPVNHACHQDLSASSTDVPDEAAAGNQDGCQSCALCMAFGLAAKPLFLVTADHLTQSGGHFTQTFISADLTGLTKPPIL